MAERRSEQPGAGGHAVPRDLPDQQVGGHDKAADKWEGKIPAEAADSSRENLPDPDEAGARRRDERPADDDRGEPEEPSG
ncbi:MULTISPECIES: hypothetical protein [Streptomyces]|uniref:hypothetical protein n=1 Tax=Streptomyces TaxID=1883 RepID=UPI001D150274|nr:MULTISPECIES: hypothetical protein [Streptomyces]MCC3655471.1 hypothetical protein [Streptomyces sp. S07_1.15]WSQ70210.1 hypothetical protein OG463_01405 [Streptomyces xinghaiensis]